MTALAPHLAAFLREHLPTERRASPHTCDTYAYCFQLLACFAARYSATVRMSGERQQGCPVAACVEDGVTGASRQGSRWDVTRTKR